VEHTANPIEEFEKRMKRQTPPEEKAIRAHYAIENNGTLQELKTQVKALYSKLTNA
jgi:dephospho-CoA kinase